MNTLFSWRYDNISGRNLVNFKTELNFVQPKLTVDIMFVMYYQVLNADDGKFSEIKIIYSHYFQQGCGCTQ